MKRIVFIEANPPDLHVFARMPLPRLGTLFLGTTLKENGYDVTSYVESIAPLDLEDILKADAVGISAITSTSSRSYEIAKLIKKAGIPVFMGGPHVTYLPEEALEYCDYVVRGEADDIILDFVKALETGEGFDKIPGLTYRKDGEVVHNQSAVFCKDLDKVPCPDFTILNGFGPGQKLKKFTIAPVMTSRGCPYDCSFCSVTGMFGQKYRFRSKERVLEELEHIKELGGKWVFFYDDNFIANKNRTKELLRAMIERDLTPNWTAQVRVEVARDQELMDLMKKAGCHTVYIGLESINPATARADHKEGGPHGPADRIAQGLRTEPGQEVVGQEPVLPRLHPGPYDGREDHRARGKENRRGHQGKVPRDRTLRGYNPPQVPLINPRQKGC
jgi:radical SAM superfamily enzyme YgiQ (UPF0313 family)